MRKSAGCAFGTNKIYDFDISRADDVYLFGNNVDNEKNDKVLDFSCGIGGNVLGYNNRIVDNAIVSQINRGFLGVSNSIKNIYTEELANKLCNIAGFIKQNKGGQEDIDGKVIFCNSASDANECAIKTARRRYNTLCDRRYSEIICFQNAFHGNTITTISTTKKNKNTIGFDPLLSGFKVAKYNDIASVKNLITEHTSAVMIEPIQYQYGIKVCEIDFLQQLKKVCLENEIVLIVDETKCGCGRSGDYFAFEKSGIIPDLITFSSSVANGFPICGCIVKNDVMEFMPSNCEFDLFCENALGAKIASAVIEEVYNEDFLLNVKLQGEYFEKLLKHLKRKYNLVIQKICCGGLMASLKLYDEISNEGFARILFANGLLSCVGDNNNVLFFPPLNIAKQQINEAIMAIETSIQQVQLLERY